MVHYCFHCGQALQHKDIDDHLREICPACGWIYYEQLKLSAAVRVVQDGKLLLAQRGIEPWYGTWYMPAGYVEVDEHPLEAAAREAREETGLDVRLLALVKEYIYRDDPRGNGLVLLYDACVVGGVLATSLETLAVGFFSPEEILAMPLASSGVKAQIMDWIQEVQPDLLSGRMS
jgi:8-oxo-dGTP diphosphatase